MMRWLGGGSPTWRLRLPASALAALLVFTLSSCAPAESEFNYLRLQVDGQSTLAVTRKDARIRGIIVYFHGYDQDEFAMTSNADRKDMTGVLVNAGFAVVASQAGGNAFDDRRTLQNYQELGSMAREHFQIDNVYFLADALGAIQAANLLASPGSPVRGFAAINPVLNIASARTEFPAFAANGPEFTNTMQDPIALPPTTFAGKNIRFYVSPQDSLVPSDDNAAQFERRFGYAANISIVPCTGGHGDASCAQGEDIAKWLTQLDSKT